MYFIYPARTTIISLLSIPEISDIKRNSDRRSMAVSTFIFASNTKLMIVAKNAFFKCHSGGAFGSDSHFEILGALYGIETLAYSYQTFYNKSIHKVEISEADFQDGIQK